MPQKYKYNSKTYTQDGVVVDDNGHEVPWYDDDYDYWKRENERSCDPLDDDYNKYDNE